jgi:hypothetical protein
MIRELQRQGAGPLQGRRPLTALQIMRMDLRSEVDKELLIQNRPTRP